MQKNRLLTGALLLGCSGLSTQTMAIMPTNAILQFDAGAVECAIGGTPPDNCDFGVTNVTGSYFGMDLSGNGAIENDSASNERHAIAPNANVILGTTQPATGSHSGAPNDTESPGIDLPWSFGGNTGMHLTNKAVTVISDDGAGTVTLDMQGWGVTWNDIAFIAMGGCQFGDPANNGGASPCDKAPTDGTDDYVNSGIATVSCYSDAALTALGTCAEGDYFVLNHEANVPVGDPSGFDGIYYTTYLIGTIGVPALFETDAGGVTPGSIADSASSADGRISVQDMTDQGITADDGYSYSGGLVDFILTGTGATSKIVIPLAAPIPANALYRKYIGGTWVNFTEDALNKFESAPSTLGACPSVGNVLYTNGLTEGNNCLQLTIEDGGSNDADGLVNATISDPSGIATADQDFIDTRVASTDGCSMSNKTSPLNNHADWLLIAGFFGLLGLFRLKRNQA